MTREEAINYVKENLLDENNTEALETLIPELKKSEDERMKELIIATINLYYGEPLEEEAKQMIAWLERKGSNNVKPKFKVGDFIVYESTSSIYQIKDCLENISNHKYEYKLTNCGFIDSDEINHYHLWTIQNAKDGDILVHKDKPFIFKGLVDTNYPDCPVAYCGINDCDKFIVGSLDYYWSNANVKPATKEQRELLFQKIYEADYRWDDEKKELIPIK